MSSRCLKALGSAASLGTVVAVFVAGCGGAVPASNASSLLPATTVTGEAAANSSTSEPVADPDAAIARAAARVEAVLGLPAGTVTASSEAPKLDDADVVLAWKGEGTSRAWVDLDTGRILGIIPGTVGDSSGEPLSHAELERTALRVAEQLGWDEAALVAEGFTPEDPRILPHGDAPTEYSRRWAGHDESGLPNQGLIDVALDVTNAELLHFFYIPRSRTALDATETINQEEAIAVAKGVIGDSSQVPTTDTAPPGESTMTTLPIGVVLRSAELVHSAAPGITGGRDMLVWIVKLGGSQATGEVRATVYIDALTGEVLTWLVGLTAATGEGRGRAGQADLHDGHRPPDGVRLPASGGILKPRSEWKC